MRTPNPQWSILIVTLFLLIITWLIGIIVMVYIRSMLAFTNTFHDYQQAFYIANAGLELQLVKARNHGFGYEDTVKMDSVTVTKNIGDMCLKECAFGSDLKTKSYVLGQAQHISSNTTTCIQDIWYTTDSDKIISSLFLFQDTTTDPENEGDLVSTKKLTSINNTNIKIFVYGLSSYRLALQATSSSGEVSNFDKIEELTQPEIALLDYQASFLNKIPDDYQIRVKIINDLKQTGTVCFQSTAGNLKLPWFHQVITSLGSYNKTSVRLQAIQTNIPGDEQDLAWGSV